MKPKNVQDIIEMAIIDCEPKDVRQRLCDWLELRIEHKRGTAPKSEFNMTLHMAAVYEIIEELGKEGVYISAEKVRLAMHHKTNISIFRS